MKGNWKIVATIVIAALVFGLLGGCSQSQTDKIKVMTSTTLLTYIAEQVGGNHVEVLNLIPPNQHPGNFDVKPDDIQRLSTARLFILWGVPGETWADQLIASANNPNLTVVKASVPGNWLIPSVQSEGTDKVLAALIEVDPDNAADYQKAANAYKKRIQDEETEIRNKLTAAKVSEVSAIASARQADFLQWAGFNVVASFQSVQSLTPQVVKDMVDQGKAAGVKIVVNNLQDGPDAGKAIAEEIGAQNVNLSNFPGGFSNTETWEKALDYNVKLLTDAIK